MKTCGKELYDVIYSTPSGLWVIWQGGEMAYKIMDYYISSISLNMDSDMVEYDLLGGDYFELPGIPTFNMDLSLSIGNVESKPVKQLSDIFTVEDLKNLSKVISQKFRSMS